MEEKSDFKNIFFDKRDSNFIKLTSNHYFFEIFSKKQHKCDQMIPESIIFSSGFQKTGTIKNKYLKRCP